MTLDEPTVTCSIEPCHLPGQRPRWKVSVLGPFPRDLVIVYLTSEQIAGMHSITGEFVRAVSAPEDA